MTQIEKLELISDKPFEAYYSLITSSTLHDIYQYHVDIIHDNLTAFYSDAELVTTRMNMEMTKQALLKMYFEETI